MLRLYVQAPFAAFRTFTAGWYRPTAGFLTHSAAYGLALNLAGIETRRDDGLSAMTVTVFDLPPARIALGADPGNPRGPYPTIHSIYQQLHRYPVGSEGMKPEVLRQVKERAKGTKYRITPVRREILADLRAIVVLDIPEHPEFHDVEGRIRRALDRATPDVRRSYGLPFLGDNTFLIDKIEVCDEQRTAIWYHRLGPEAGATQHSTRLTTWIDRQDMSRTRSDLFAPFEPASAQVPEAAWTLIEPPAKPMSPAKSLKKRGQP
jgi:CRISPR-associated protein Cas5t